MPLGKRSSGGTCPTPACMSKERDISEFMEDEAGAIRAPTGLENLGSLNRLGGRSSVFRHFMKTKIVKEFESFNYNIYYLKPFWGWRWFGCVNGYNAARRIAKMLKNELKHFTEG